MIDINEIKIEYNNKIPSSHKQLKPSDALIKKAYKKLKKEANNYIKKVKQGKIYRIKLNFWYHYLTIRNKEVIRYEFVYHIPHRKGVISEEEKHQFEFIESFNYKRKIGLLNEKKTYSGIVGWLYKPSFHSFVNDYRVKTMKDGSFKTYLATIEKSPSYKKIKINDYLNIDGEKVDSALDVQRMISKNSDHVEILYKMGFKNLVHLTFSQEKINFIIKHKKTLSRNISKKELDFMYQAEKKGIKNWEELFKMFEGYYQNTYYGRPFFSYNQNNKIDLSYYDFDYKRKDYDRYRSVKAFKKIETMNRVYNLIKEGTEKFSDLIDFAGVCWKLNLNIDKEILKGKKERDQIIEQYTKEKNIYDKAEKKRRRALQAKQKKENEERIALEEKIKTMVLPDVTTKFASIDLENFVFEPIRTFDEFVKISNELNICLVRNEFHKKVLKEQSIIYLAYPKEKTFLEGEVIEWNLTKNKGININQIHGKDNKNTEYYYKIKEIANSLKYNDLVQLQNLKGEGYENQISN